MAISNSLVPPAPILIDRDYVGTLSSVSLFGVPADAGAVVTWYLYDSANVLLGTGLGAYVPLSTGNFQVVIPYTAFAAQAATITTNGYARGRVHVTLSQNGAQGSWGSPVVFQYPTGVAA